MLFDAGCSFLLQFRKHIYQGEKNTQRSKYDLVLSKPIVVQRFTPQTAVRSCVIGIKLTARGHLTTETQ